MARVGGGGRVADEHAADGVDVADDDEEAGAVDEDRRHGAHVRHRRLDVHGARRRAAAATPSPPLREHEQRQTAAAHVERQDVDALQVARVRQVVRQQQEENAGVQCARADGQARRHHPERRLGAQRQRAPHLPHHVVQVDTEVLHRRVAVECDQNRVRRLAGFKYRSHEFTRQVVGVVVIVVDVRRRLLHFLQGRTASCTRHQKQAH